VASGEDEPPFCYLTTTGRVSARPHRIEIWFATAGGRVYLLSGGRDHADWVRNLVVSPDVTLELGDRVGAARARVVEEGTEEDALARRSILEKYRPGYGGDLTSWGRTSLAVAVEWVGT
jgi:deazaflavin-dependent oxidoreductase (nitroreductase family)